MNGYLEFLRDNYYEDLTEVPEKGTNKELHDLFKGKDTIKTTKISRFRWANRVIRIGDDEIIKSPT